MFPNACTLLFFQNALKGAWKQLQRDDATSKRFLCLLALTTRTPSPVSERLPHLFQDLVFILFFVLT